MAGDDHFHSRLRRVATYRGERRIPESKNRKHWEGGEELRDGNGPQERGRARRLIGLLKIILLQAGERVGVHVVELPQCCSFPAGFQNGRKA
jgi:hypothetical protein